MPHGARPMSAQARGLTRWWPLLASQETLQAIHLDAAQKSIAFKHGAEDLLGARSWCGDGTTGICSDRCKPDATSTGKAGGDPRRAAFFEQYDIRGLSYHYRRCRPLSELKVIHYSRPASIQCTQYEPLKMARQGLWDGVAPLHWQLNQA
jgi:hypothetical protein